ncbi:MAG: hypothetical protein WAQ24_04795 [Candidatus Saccharimonadales bacterium]
MLNDDFNQEKPTPSASQQKKRPRSLRPLLYIIILFAAILVSTIIIATYNRSAPLNKYAKTLQFQLYYPRSLPNDYKIDETSITVSNDILNYTIQSPNGAVQCTQQAAPDSLASYRIDGFSPVATPIGSMLVGTAAGGSTAIIKTPSTLITLRATNNKAEAAIMQIAQALQPLQQKPSE